MPPLTPVGLKQLKTNTNFLHSACQAIRIPLEMCLRNGISSQALLLASYLQMVQNTRNCHLQLAFYAHFEEIALGENSDDAMQAMVNILTKCTEGTPAMRDVFSLRILRETRNTCVECQKSLPSIVQTMYLNATLCVPITHSIFSAITQSANCVQCRSVGNRAVVKFPRVLLVRVPKQMPDVGPLGVEKFIHIGSVTYQLVSVIMSTGNSSSALCYYPDSFTDRGYLGNTGKWYLCNDEVITPFQLPQGDFFIPPKFVLCVVYCRVSEIGSLSNTKLVKICGQNDIPWRLKITELMVQPKTKNLWPTIHYREQYSSEIDIRFSRQAYLNLQKVSFEQKHVLLVGLTPTTFEVAKNLVSMGFLQLSVKIDTTASSKSSIAGTARLEAYHEFKASLKAINKAAFISEFRDELTEFWLTFHKVRFVVVVDHYLFDLVPLNEVARRARAVFVAGDQTGLLLSMFADYGEGEFTYRDAEGEPEIDEPNVFVENLIEAKEIPNGFVDLKVKLHIIPDGDLIFSDTVADAEIAVKIQEEDMNMEQKIVALRMPKLNADNFQALFTKSAANIHLKRKVPTESVTFHTLRNFESNHSLPLISPTSPKFWQLLNNLLRQLYHDYARIVSDTQLSDENCARMMNSVSEEMPSTVSALLNNIAFRNLFLLQLKRCYIGMTGSAPPAATILGGYLAHAVFAGATKSFRPLHQWLHVDLSDVIDSQFILAQRSKVSAQSKSDQDLLFGQDIVRTMTNLNVLQIGCGATGCETAKLLLEMGLTKVTFVDGDAFSRSNRNRQFLCTESDEFLPKSEVVVTALKSKFSKATNLQLQSIPMAISDKTAHKFTPELIATYDVIIGTVDSGTARVHCCELAHTQKKFFIECGTSSLTYSTSMYAPATNDLRATPLYYFNPQTETLSFNCNPVVYCMKDSHTIQAAVILFSEWFSGNFDLAKDAMISGSDLPHIKQYCELIYNIKSASADFTVKAEQLFVSLFEMEFYTKIDTIAKEMKKEGPLCNVPKPTHFDPTQALHRDLRASFCSLLQSVVQKRESLEFNKDNVEHLRHIKMLAELRCDIFGIAIRDFDIWRIQRIAGHSLPSIITSTAISAGLNCLNLYKIAQIKMGGNPQLSSYAGKLSAFFMDKTKIDRNGPVSYSLSVSDTCTLGELKALIISSIPVFDEDELEDKTFENRCFELISQHHIQCFPLSASNKDKESIQLLMRGLPIRAKLYELYGSPNTSDPYTIIGFNL